MMKHKSRKCLLDIIKKRSGVNWHVSFLLGILLISGCYVGGFYLPNVKEFTNVKQEVTSVKHDVLLVPFKAPPIDITIMSVGSAVVGFLWGSVGDSVFESATADKREKIANTMNELLKDWCPTDVLAKECVNLIQQSSHFKVQNITIANFRELPGVEALRLKEPRLFTSKRGGVYTTLSFEWIKAATREWRAKNSTIQYKNEYPQVYADMALEASYMYIGYSVEEEKIELWILIMLKLIDINSGKTIATGTSDNSQDPFEILQVDKIQNSEIFKEKFSARVKQECSKILGGMGILSNWEVRGQILQVVRECSRAGWVEARNPAFFECHEWLRLGFALLNPTLHYLQKF